MASGARLCRFDAGVRPFAVTADERRLYVQRSNIHAVVADDLEAREIAQRPGLPVAPSVGERDWDFEAPHRGLALTPDEETLCLTGRAGDYAGLVATDDLSLLETVPVGGAPSRAALDAVGECCDLANTRSDDVSIVSVERREEVTRLTVGRGPEHVSVGALPETVRRSFRGRVSGTAILPRPRDQGADYRRAEPSAFRDRQGRTRLVRAPRFARPPRTPLGICPAGLGTL